MNKKKIKSLHPSLNCSEDLLHICSPLKELGITYFSHVKIDEIGRFSALGLKPEFINLYLDKEYYKYDIHMAKTRMSEQYILWDTIERKKESKELHDDFMSLSLGHTFTIIQENNQSKDYFHFAGKLGDHNINDRYLQNLDLLKKFILYFNDKINSHKELKKGYDIKLEIPKKDSGYYISDKTSFINASSFIQATDVQRMYIDNKNYITKGEFACLHWLSHGKTIDEIARILRITPRTIKAHIKNIKNKFALENQFQLGLLYSKLKSVVTIEPE